MPFSSPYSAQCLPTPGPATVRLALIRTSVELFGLSRTRDTLFPAIRETAVKIRPPDRVAISNQMLRMYKASQSGLAESIGYREFAQADGNLVIYLEVPVHLRGTFIQLLHAIGYWGQASSLTYCQRVYEAKPETDKVGRPLDEMVDVGVGNRATAFMTDWRKQDTTWQMVVGQESGQFLETRLFVFPLEVCERQSSGRLFVSRSSE
jgi:hypothetical protein